MYDTAAHIRLRTIDALFPKHTVCIYTARPAALFRDTYRWHGNIYSLHHNGALQSYHVQGHIFALNEEDIFYTVPKENPGIFMISLEQYLEACARLI